MPDLYGYALGLWVAFAVFAFLNGWLRARVIEPRLGEPVAHRLASVTLAVFVLLATYALLGEPALEATRADLLAVGMLWVALTVAFEFGVGHYVLRQPWRRLLADYNLAAGRLWSLVLIAELVSPLLWGALLNR